MLKLNQDILRSAVLLGAFAAVGTGLLLWVDGNTAARIAANERATLLAQLTEIIPQSEYDNALLSDTLQVEAADYLGSAEPLTMYLATREQQPVAAVFTSIAPDGYSGTIKLLVGVYSDGTIAGVRVVSHKETPGLGDAIEAQRSDWILRFNGKSLQNPLPSAWAVKPDGGEFDAFTGATITPRAVVKAVRKTLNYFAEHKTALFADLAAPEISGENQ